MLAADLPPIPAADRALDEVRTGKVGGLSVEFRAVKESIVDGIRVIHEAVLSGVGLVAMPSYYRRERRSPGAAAARMALTPTELAALATTVAERITGTVLGRESAADDVQNDIAAAAVETCCGLAPGAPLSILREASNPPCRVDVRLTPAPRR